MRQYGQMHGCVCAGYIYAMMMVVIRDVALILHVVVMVCRQGSVHIGNWRV